MSHLKGDRITGDMIRMVLDPDNDHLKRVGAWLVKKDGIWDVISAGGVAGDEEHILTAGTIAANGVKVDGQWEYGLMACGWDGMLSTVHLTWGKDKA